MRSGQLAVRAAIFFFTATAAAQSLQGGTHSFKDLYSLSLSATTKIGPSSNAEAADGGQVVSQAIGAGTSSKDHAMLWTASSGTGVDLNPQGFSSSAAIGTDGSQQVGYGTIATTTKNHALLWYGNALSAVDLNPAGFTLSFAYGTDGTQEVGSGAKTGSVVQALLWRGSAASVINLNPKGFTTSVANGTNGKRQIGQGYGKATGNNDHAILWTSNAKSAVDLNPTNLAGVRSSFGLGIGGAEQVGYGVDTQGEHEALLWHGTAASAVNLNPAKFAASFANGTNGAQQVGDGWGDATDGEEHALLWSGDAKSYVDLGALLPSGFTRSFAFSINAAGEVFGYAQTATGTYDAIEWQPALADTPSPEPGAAVFLSVGSIAILRRRRRAN